MNIKKRKGISLIVLIVTIIVVIILAAVVILTISKNNPVDSSREAKFKEDIRTFQDDLLLSISKDYTKKAGQRDNKFNATSYDKIKEYIPSFTKEYEGKIAIYEKRLAGLSYRRYLQNMLKLKRFKRMNNGKLHLSDEYANGGNHEQSGTQKNSQSGA